jgi:hypothetical protein
MKTKTFAFFGSVTLFVALATRAQTSPPTTQGQTITFDAPGAGTNNGVGTVPRNINPNGEITGEYYDSSVAVHGFVRASDGTISTFDVPGASKSNGQGTFPRSINPRGDIAG